MGVSQMVGFCERENANLKWMRTGGIKKTNRKPPYAYGFLRKSSINGGLFIYVHMYSYVSLCKIHNRIAARVATLMKWIEFNWHMSLFEHVGQNHGQHLNPPVERNKANWRRNQCSIFVDMSFASSFSTSWQQRFSFDWAATDTTRC